MRKNPSLIFCATLVAVVFTLITNSAASDKQTTLYNFQGVHTGKADGATPQGGLIADAAGNLYGTTYYGGSTCTLSTIKGCGTIFELSPNGSGGWTEAVLYKFTGGADGAFPTGNLVFDASGNLYGTAFLGGNSSCVNGCGTVFELSPSSSGGWAETAIYSFTGGADGLTPVAGLVFDAAGNLFGATSQGGSSSTCGQGCGTVFELSPSSSGWTKKTLHSFSFSTSSNLGGIYPVGGVILDASGNIYGTLSQGASTTCNPGSGCGSVFRLTKGSVGYTFNLLYTFQGPRGQQPINNLVMDAAGNLYGTTPYGGPTQSGLVFELSPTTQGQWKETLLHVFNGTTEGFFPQGVTIDAAGNIYGTSNGVAFRLTQSSGGWQFQILSTLSSGDSFNAPLLRDANANMYGVTYTGGSQTAGTVYELSPITAAK
jgi:uncharacterized repeat protein (TIGR03803 family)